MPDVLAITSELPWPLDSGGKLRTFHVQKALAQAFDHRLIVPVREDQINHVAELKNKGINVVPVLVSARTKPGELGRLVRARLRGEPYVMYGRHSRSQTYTTVASEVSRDPPRVLWLDHIDSLLFLKHRRTGMRAIIDLHNMYSLILERMATESGNPLRRWFFRGEARRLAAIERRAARDCDAIVAVSAPEAAHYRSLGANRVMVAPNGVDCAAFASMPTGRASCRPIILFVGTLSWGPNVSAAIRLANEIYPQVREQLPAAELWLVGRDPAAEIRALAGAGITVAGSVPDIRPYLREAALLAVPLDAGGGTRLKILEAFAAGLPVVSTAIGAEGIDAASGEHFVIAERDDMASASVRILSDAGEGVRLATNARRLATERYDWAVVGEVCVRAVRECLDQR